MDEDKVNVMDDAFRYLHANMSMWKFQMDWRQKLVKVNGDPKLLDNKYKCFGVSGEEKGEVEGLHFCSTLN